MGRSVSVVDVDVESTDGHEEKLKLLASNAHDISMSIAEGEDEFADDDDDGEDESEDEETMAEKIERKTKRFEHRKEKYQKVCRLAASPLPAPRRAVRRAARCNALATPSLQPPNGCRLRPFPLSPPALQYANKGKVDKLNKVQDKQKKKLQKAKDKGKPEPCECPPFEHDATGPRTRRRTAPPHALESAT